MRKGSGQKMKEDSEDAEAYGDRGRKGGNDADFVESV